MFETNGDERGSLQEDYIETDYIIHKIDHDSESIIFGLYTKLNLYEQHFHTLQSKFRVLSTTLLLAVFTGIGWLFISDVDLPISIWRVSSLICAGGIIALLGLWQQDLTVFQNLAESVFVEEIKMEKKYKWLPNTRTNILNLRKKNKIKFFQSYFYMGFIGMLALLISGFMFLDLYSGSLNILLIVLASIVVASAIIIFGMGKITIRVHNLWKKIEKKLE